MPRDITIGFSPCPNDTFIFYALVNNKILNNDYRFHEIYEDVETLNMMAMDGRLDITKVSYHALGYIRDDYCLLRAGGALGRGCGPLVVAAKSCDIDDLVGKRIAVPGRYTTAFLLLQLRNPAFGDNILFMPFHEIMESVRKGESDAGVIIHESRFTYDLYGLHEIMDLGRWWEDETGLPIPLGAIVGKRGLGPESIKKIDRFIRASIDYAFSNREEPLPYIKQYAQEISDAVISKHIDLYVNDYSLDLGEEGEKAIRKLIMMAEDRGIFKRTGVPLFFS